MIDWRLCLVADSEAARGRNILDLIQKAVEGGATIVQLRGKIWSTREFLKIGLTAAEFLNKIHIPLIINDRIDIALACDAAGVHLGQQDLPLSFARDILGNSKIIGISVNSVDEALEAEKEGANYLGAGPVFPTLSKQDLRPGLGLEELRRIKEKVKIPVLAIGGINLSNAREVVSAGADGIAVISALLWPADIRQAAAELIETITRKEET